MSDYEKTLGIEITEASTDRATAVLKIKKTLTDELGHVPGGIYTCLADACGSAAANAGEALYVTQNCSLQFYQSTTCEDKELIAKAFIRHRGSRTCIAAVELSHKDGEIVADGQFSYSKVADSK